MNRYELHRYCNVIDQTLFGVKRLVNFKFDELKSYLEYETEQILKIGQDKNFSDQ